MTPAPILGIATYQPREGQVAVLTERLCAHEAALTQQACLGDEPLTRVAYDDGCVLEIIEWRDDESRVRATQDPAIRAAWRAIEDVTSVARRIDLI